MGVTKNAKSKLASTATASQRPITASTILRALCAAANPEKAAGMRRFFKTGPGEYGEGDQFLGLPNPVLRALLKEFKGAPVEEAWVLLKSPWHEIRLFGGLLLVERYRRGEEAEREHIFKAYLANAARFNNWDLVDLTAPDIVGAHLLARNRALLFQLAKRPVLWEQRIAMVATLTLIRNGDFDECLRLAEGFLSHPHDLMHKATGWMLREVGKRNPGRLHAFLRCHAAQMPRTMLRYAIEHEPEEARQRWLQKGNVSRSPKSPAPRKTK